MIKYSLYQRLNLPTITPKIPALAKYFLNSITNFTPRFFIKKISILTQS